MIATLTSLTFEPMTDAEIAINQRAERLAIDAAKAKKWIKLWDEIRSFEVVVVTEAKPTIAHAFNGKTLTITIDGKTAKRNTKNDYNYAIVGTDANGDLKIAYCSMDKQSTNEAMEKAINPGNRCFNFNFHEIRNNKVVHLLSNLTIIDLTK